MTPPAGHAATHSLLPGQAGPSPPLFGPAAAGKHSTWTAAASAASLGCSLPTHRCRPPPPSALRWFWSSLRPPAAAGTPCRARPVACPCSQSRPGAPRAGGCKPRRAAAPPPGCRGRQAAGIISLLCSWQAAGRRWGPCVCQWESGTASECVICRRSGAPSQLAALCSFMPWSCLELSRSPRPALAFPHAVHPCKTHPNLHPSVPTFFRAPPPTEGRTAATHIQRHTRHKHFTRPSHILFAHSPSPGSRTHHPLSRPPTHTHRGQEQHAGGHERAHGRRDKHRQPVGGPQPKECRHLWARGSGGFLAWRVVHGDMAIRGHHSR